MFSSPEFALPPVFQPDHTLPPRSDSSPILGLHPQPCAAQKSLVLLHLTQTQKAVKPRGPTTDRPFSPRLCHLARVWCYHLCYSNCSLSAPPKLSISNSCPESSSKEGKKQQLPANSAQVPQKSMWKSTHGKLPEPSEDEEHNIIAMPCQLDSILTTELGEADMQPVS